MSAHQPRKRFGQNFLQSQVIIDQILQAFRPEVGDNVVEIGPGLGALTQPLLKYLPKMTAIEIDRDLHENLSQLAGGHLTLISADALTVDYSKLGESLRVIGNLPYNISTPLLLHLLHFTPHIQDMLFMLQKEVAERLAASHGNKTYGRLSVMTQVLCDVEYLFDVPPSAFHPMPKVDSAIIRLIPHETTDQDLVWNGLEKLLAQAFSMRRKTLANNLKPLLTAAQLQAIGIDASKRPEQISIIEYVQIAKFLTN